MHSENHICRIIFTFKRSVAGFNVKEVDNSKFDSQPDIVDNVVLPTDIVESNRVHVLVEPESDVDGQEHDSDALGADVEWKNLDTVADEQTRPGRVVADVVDENEGNHGVTSGSVAVHLRLSVADGGNDEDNSHTGGGEEEELPTTDTLDEEAHADSNDQIDDLKNTVDKSLAVSICNADLSENDG